MSVHFPDYGWLFHKLGPRGGKSESVNTGKGRKVKCLNYSLQIFFKKCIFFGLISTTATVKNVEDLLSVEVLRKSQDFGLGFSPFHFFFVLF